MHLRLKSGINDWCHMEKWFSSTRETARDRTANYWENQPIKDTVSRGNEGYVWERHQRLPMDPPQWNQRAQEIGNEYGVGSCAIHNTREEQFQREGGWYSENVWEVKESPTSTQWLNSMSEPLTEGGRKQWSRRTDANSFTGCWVNQSEQEVEKVSSVRVEKYLIKHLCRRDKR